LTNLIRGINDSHGSHPRSCLTWGTIILATLGAFLLAPGDIEQKAHIALHGVCAQRPSHSLQLGGATLPLDARMTGIYLGAVTTAVWLAATRRLRAQARPGMPVLVTLAAFLVVMAADGSNALLVDLGLPGFYLPSNVLRLATGILAGVALGTAFGYLFAITIWRGTHSQAAVIERPAELIVPTSLASVLGALALSGLPMLFAPLAIGLVFAVLAVIAALLLIVIVLASGRAWRIDDFRQIGGMAVTACILAILIVTVFSALRLTAEQTFGLPQLT
jgi:uncharacterized membrane protein